MKHFTINQRLVVYVGLLALIPPVLGIGCGDGTEEKAGCQPSDCNSPPQPHCEEGVLVKYEPEGRCEKGVCLYESNRTNCPHGCSPIGAQCIAEENLLCDGTVCLTPPDPFCDRHQAVIFENQGECNPQTGNCEYPEERTDCHAHGQLCFAGMCMDIGLCEGVVCDTSPEPRCEGNVAITYAVGGCNPETGLCHYPEESTDCAALICYQGACVQPGLCDNVVCEDPPIPYCDDGSAVNYGPEGACNPITGLCEYQEERTHCHQDHLYCHDGLCYDRCEGIWCTQPPSSHCNDEGDLVQYLEDGVCDWQTADCIYPPHIVPCAQEQLRCVEEVGDNEPQEPYCIDLCEEKECLDPTQPHCEQGEAVSYQNPGICDWQTGECHYPEEREDCQDMGWECIEGGCFAPPAESCQPCEEDRECGYQTGVCLELYDGSFCVVFCEEDENGNPTGGEGEEDEEGEMGCPQGFTCTEMEGETIKVCLPDLDSCLEADCTGHPDCNHPACSLEPICRSGYNFDFEDWSAQDPPPGFSKSHATHMEVTQEIDHVNTGDSAAKVLVHYNRTENLQVVHHLPIQPDQEYTFHLWAYYEGRMGDSTSWIKPGMNYFTSDGELGTRLFWGGGASGTSITETPGWAEFSMTRTAGSDEAWLQPFLRAKNGISYTNDWAITIPVVFDIEDGDVHPDAHFLAESVSSLYTLHGGLNNAGQLYLATNRAENSLGDRAVYLWVGGMGEGLVGAPRAKGGQIHKASEGGALFALFQQESTSACEWLLSTPQGWQVVEPETSGCNGEGAIGSRLEGYVNLPQIMELSRPYGKENHSQTIPAIIEVAALYYQHGDGGQPSQEGALPEGVVDPDSENGTTVYPQEVLEIHRANLLVGQVSEHQQ